MQNPRKLFGGLGNRLFQMAYIYGQAFKKEIDDTYVQDPKHFAHCAEFIRELYSTDIKPIDMVSLHVRRGDYNSNGYYVNLAETTYYDDAIAQFPGEKFLVFCADRQDGSDDHADLEWCKERFQGPQFEFYQGKDEIDDFNAMAGCKAHIIANSSFSWMAAFIGGGKTISPSKWYTDERPGITALDNWTAL